MSMSADDMMRIEAALRRHLPEHHQHIEISVETIIEDIDALGSALRDSSVVAEEAQRLLYVIVGLRMDLDESIVIARRFLGITR